MNVYTILIVAISLGALSEALDQDNGPLISALQPITGPETAETPAMSTDLLHPRLKREQGPIETAISGIRQALAKIIGRTSQFIDPTTSAPVIIYQQMGHGPGYGNGYGPGNGFPFPGYGPNSGVQKQ